MDVQEVQARTNEGPLQSLASETILSDTAAEAAWGYAAFGSGIGLSNIVIAEGGSPPEVYSGGSFSTFGGNSYWYALRYNSTTPGYDQVYVSPFFTSGIRRIRVGDLIGDSAKEIVVALSNGQVILYKQNTKAVLQTVNTTITDLSGLDIADVDGDGANELVLCSTNHLYVYSGSGVLKWDLANVGGYDVVVAQMDNDAALEIATTDGHVVDGAAHSPQWTWSYGFGSRLAAADFDNDGRQELIVGESGFVWAYDVDQQLPKWSISEYVQAMLVSDIDSDGHLEVLVGQGQWGSIVCYDLETQQKEWFIPNPEHGVTNIAVGDVDGDGKTELLWGAGASSSGPDHLYVVNWETKQFEWENVHLDGPFIGPEIGDLDGDGRDEMVVISTYSDSGYSSGRILVFDAVTRKLRGISPPTMGGLGWTGIHDLRLRDVNADGKMEILVAASFTYDGVIEIYGFDSSNSFTLKWTNSTRPSFASFYCVDAADIDNDGEMEIIGGAGGYLYVYSYASGNEEWHTLYMRGNPTALGIADVNQDGTKEIIGMVNGGDVYIFDGPSRALKAILVGPFSAMRVQNVGGLLSIVLGDDTGYLIMYRYSSGSYAEIYRQRLVTASVDGFTIDPRDRVWIGSHGASFSGPGTLTEVTLAGAVLATYSSYGSTFGLRTAFEPTSLLFFTTGSYSVVAFPTCTASLSSMSQTFTSTGGNGTVDITAAGDCDWGAVSNASWISITSGGSSGNGTLHYSVATNPGSGRSGTITIAGQIFTINQPSGDSTGLYEPIGGAFFFKYSNTSGPSDYAFTFGPANQGWTPVVGDWNADGVDTIGLYYPANGAFFIRNSNTSGIADIYITYGPAGQGWLPVIGDWDGNGTDTLGLYNPDNGSFYLRNSNTVGFADLTFAFGPIGGGWIPIVGDWNGDGVDTVGLYNPSTRAVQLRNSNTSGAADVSFTFTGAGPTWKVIVGDWDGNGTSSLGLYNPATGAFSLRNANTTGGANISITWEGGSYVPIAGKWQ
ncbi:MAG: FG-GAP-like repeat-containing protein [Acidobacteriota bacterium]